MAVSGVSASSLTYQSNPFTDFRQAFMQMAKAVNAGDLAGAQQAYASLGSLPGGNQNDGNSAFGQALDQIGQDLQNGDIGAAQQTLSSLKSQAHHAHHHHGGHRSPPSDATASDTDASQTDGSTGSTVNVLA